MRLLDLIKQAGVGAYDATNPVAILPGTVTNTNPLEVNVEQRFTLTEDFLLVPESLTLLELDLKHSHSTADGVTGESLTTITIRRGLEVGDIVLLIRVQGGQQFIILDRMVGP
ncbi:DUF2577 domain-containing protein [Paenibacillus sp. TAB 01]|uniref:DUF2577 domain-containing protein n=1 Tax=Paenibacillus sp. TAB 01 TaxID=3368988 RepID=UPI003751203B